MWPQQVATRRFRPPGAGLWHTDKPGRLIDGTSDGSYCRGAVLGRGIDRADGFSELTVSEFERRETKRDADFGHALLNGRRLRASPSPSPGVVARALVNAWRAAPQPHPLEKCPEVVPRLRPTAASVFPRATKVDSPRSSAPPARLAAVVDDLHAHDVFARHCLTAAGIARAVRTGEGAVI